MCCGSILSCRLLGICWISSCDQHKDNKRNSWLKRPIYQPKLMNRNHVLRIHLESSTTRLSLLSSWNSSLILMISFLDLSLLFITLIRRFRYCSDKFHRSCAKASWLSWHSAVYELLLILQSLKFLLIIIPRWDDVIFLVTFTGFIESSFCLYVRAWS